jgi:uncharacterized membrane protein
MKSRASIADHPLHPALVALPIGAFFLALLGDIAYLVSSDLVWWNATFYCLVVGILTALLAAIAGLIDYFGVNMSQAGRRIATLHMSLNIAAVTLYIVSYVLRLPAAAPSSGRWLAAVLCEVVPFLPLGISGWLGGELVFKHKVAVVEGADREATMLGQYRA